MCQPPDELLKISDSSASYGPAMEYTQHRGEGLAKSCAFWMEKWNQSLEKGAGAMATYHHLGFHLLRGCYGTGEAHSVGAKRWFLPGKVLHVTSTCQSTFHGWHMDQIPNEGSWVTSSTANPKLSAIGSHVCRPHSGSSALIAIPTRNPFATPASCRQDTYMATLKIKVSLLAFVSDIKLKSNSTSCHWPQVEWRGNTPQFKLWEIPINKLFGSPQFKFIAIIM